MERTVEVRHVSVEVKAGFDSFTQNLERSLDEKLANVIRKAEIGDLIIGAGSRA